jgi:hypothetical protein
MPINYTSIAATGNRLVGENGRAVTVRKLNPAKLYDAGLDKVFSGHKSSTDVMAVFTEYRLSEIDGTKIHNGDKKVIISANAEVQADVGDEIIDGEQVYKIVARQDIAPGNKAIIYKYQVRR